MMDCKWLLCCWSVRCNLPVSNLFGVNAGLGRHSKDYVNDELWKRRDIDVFESGLANLPAPLSSIEFYLRVGWSSDIGQNMIFCGQNLAGTIWQLRMVIPNYTVSIWGQF